MRRFAPAVALLALLCTAQTPPPDCPSPAADTRAFASAPGSFAVRTPRGTLRLIAVTDEAGRERGLMCVTRIPAASGMLFVFPDDGRRDFWMKNTLVPLDMVFAAADGRVTGVAANVPATREGTPDDRVARRAGTGRYVIELAAGDAARHALRPGVRLALPPLDAKE